MRLFKVRARSAWMVSALVVLWVYIGFEDPVTGDVQRTYVGANICQECHIEQYERFLANAQKAHGFDSVKVMQKYLAAEELQSCYACHTTGYGEPGGFVSEVETPHLKHPGCEVCHGPGSVHVDTEDPADINGAVSIDDCHRCHTNERVNAFHFKPMLKAGAH